MDSQIEELRKTIFAKDEIIKGLEVKYTELLNKYNLLLIEKDNFEKQYYQKLDEYNKLAKEFDEYKKSHNYTDEEFKTLEKNIEKAEEELARLGGLISYYEEQIKELNNIIRNDEKIINDQKVVIDDLNAEIEKLRKENKDLTDENQALINQNEKLIDEIKANKVLVIKGEKLGSDGRNWRVGEVVVNNIDLTKDRWGRVTEYYLMLGDYRLVFVEK